MNGNVWTRQWFVTIASSSHSQCNIATILTIALPTSVDDDDYVMLAEVEMPPPMPMTQSLHIASVPLQRSNISEVKDKCGHIDSYMKSQNRQFHSQKGKVAAPTTRPRDISCHSRYHSPQKQAPRPTHRWGIQEKANILSRCGKLRFRDFPVPLGEEHRTRRQYLPEESVLVSI